MRQLPLPRFQMGCEIRKDIWMILDIQLVGRAAQFFNVWQCCCGGPFFVEDNLLMFHKLSLNPTWKKISKFKDFVKQIGHFPCWVQIWPYFRAEVSSFNVVSGSFCHKLWNCFQGYHALLRSFESVGLPVLVIHSYSTMTQPFTCITRSLIFGVVSMKLVSIANFSVLLMTTTCFKVHDKYSQKWPWTNRL